jgi:di/tricarboxylate transporter
MTSTVCALACIITGCISQKKAIASVNWNVVGRLAACLGIAKALIAGGGSALVGTWFQNIVGDSIHPYLLFCILILMVQVTGELITDSTAIVMVLPIVISIAPAMGLNTYAYALGITLALAVGYSTPLGSSTLGMAMSAGYEFRDFFKYSFWFDVLAYLLIITMVPAIYGLTV